MLKTAARLLQVIEGSYKPDPDEVPGLAGAAKLNKLYLAFLRAVRDMLPDEWASEEERFRGYIKGCVEVAESLRGLGYAFYKFRRPVDHVSVDLDVLIHVDDVWRAVKRLSERGFRVVVVEPYTVTLRRGDLIVDLYTHPSFAWAVYMDGSRILRDYSEEFELNGVYVSGITREAEVAVAAAHAVYKEHIVLLIDCITAWKWLTRRALYTAEELKARGALETLIETCRAIREGSIEAPYRLPAPLLLKTVLEKTATDSTFRATAPNILRYIAKHRGPGRAILQRLTRKSY